MAKINIFQSHMIDKEKYIWTFEINEINALPLFSILVQRNFAVLKLYPLQSTVQEHQTIPTNATLSKVSDMILQWWSMRK